MSRPEPSASTKEPGTVGAAWRHHLVLQDSPPVALKIPSSRDGAFVEIDRTFRPDYHRAQLSSGSLGAELEFYEPNLSSLTTFFGELADQWRGWEGEQTWRCLEGEVALSATHNGLGTVALKAGLRSGTHTDAGPAWSASAFLYLDAGGLDRLTDEAERLASM